MIFAWYVCQIILHFLCNYPISWSNYFFCSIFVAWSLALKEPSIGRFNFQRLKGIGLDSYPKWINWNVPTFFAVYIWKVGCTSPFEGKISKIQQMCIFELLVMMRYQPRNQTKIGFLRRHPSAFQWGSLIALLLAMLVCSAGKKSTSMCLAGNKLKENLVL